MYAGAWVFGVASTYKKWRIFGMQFKPSVNASNGRSIVENVAAASTMEELEMCHVDAKEHLCGLPSGQPFTDGPSLVEYLKARPAPVHANPVGTGTRQTIEMQSDEKVYASRLYDHDDPLLRSVLSSVIVKAAHAPRVSLDFANSVRFVYQPSQPSAWMQVTIDAQHLYLHTPDPSYKGPIVVLYHLGAGLGGIVCLCLADTCVFAVKFPRRPSMKGKGYVWS